MIERLPTALGLTMLLAAWPGCAPSTPGGAADAIEVSTGVEPDVVAAVEVVPEEVEPTPATLDEIRAICRVYRQATYGRWDDQRTRGELGGLELSSDVAAGWQTRLATPDPVVALDATRAVLDAAHEAGVASACQPLVGLVAVATGFSVAPAEQSAPAEPDAATE